MRYEELLARGADFKRYLQAILPLLGRRERGHHAQVYIRDLLVEGGRKTPAAIAKRWPDGNVQALQQLTGQSPWDSWKVRRAVCELVLQELTDLQQPVWIVDDTAFPKKGDHSVGVARQYCNTLGKVANCQVAVSLHLATTRVSFPVDFALYLPRSWTEDPAAPRVRKAGLPPNVTFKAKWQLALELIDRARSWNLPAGPVVADAAYGRVVEFRRELAARQLHYVVGIDKDTLLAPLAVPSTDDGFEVYPGDCKTVSQLAREQPAAAWRKVTWRTGTKGALESRFWAARLQAPEGEVWLLAEWPPGADEPENFWLSNLPAETSLSRLVYYAKSRWWVEQNYRQLKNELGLDHYEGRTWQGWHHHVTLVMVAFGFLVLEFLRAQKKPIFLVDDTEPEASPSSVPHLMVRVLPHLQAEDC